MAQFTKQEIADITKRYIKDVKPFGRNNVAVIKKLIAKALEVEALEDRFSKLSDGELADMTVQFRGRLAEGATLDDILPEAFAVCREAAVRVLGQRHYFVQLMGGIALHQGQIAEMATGEGKTLTETLPVYLNALTGNGVHIVTVNEYLALRDASWMGKVFTFLGLTVGAITNRQPHAEKRHAYQCDITYGTNNEYGFDYLRDNMSKSIAGKVQRKLNYVVIDEVDSILIDEARTPLIISGPSGKSSQMYITANSFAVTLSASTNMDNTGELLDGEVDFNGDYVVDEKHKSARITDSGIAKAERFFGIDNLSDGEHADLNKHIDKAVRAHAVMKRDNDYIVEKGEVVIIDPHTGRKMPGRRYNDGLHQAIEAKERVTVKQENRTLASITFQNYFKLYNKMSGMTGTAKTEENEFNSIYNIDVIVMPTNLANCGVDNADMIFTTREGKLAGAIKEIERIHATGQPLLIGVASVEASEELSAMLIKKGIKHNLLNAKNHKKEADIIAQAGRLGGVTIATNMAGRGTDILLGGNADFLARQELINRGYSSEVISQVTAHNVVDPEILELQKLYTQLVDKAKLDIDVEHAKVVELGGLYVLGTERHDSRRIDNQLRGRAGRQGDHGTTQFYLSTEDSIMRRFGGMLSGTMNMFGWNKEDGLQSGMLSKQMEKAQRAVENAHFSARKNVLEYDDVINRQRNLIYAQRDNVLASSSVHNEILAMADRYARKALEIAVSGNENCALWDIEAVNANLAKQIPFVEGDVLSSSSYTSAMDALTEVVVAVNKALEFVANRPQENDDVPMEEAERYMLLSNIDRLWMDHLENLDVVKTGVAMQSIGNRKPIDVYKREAYLMFDDLSDSIAYDTIKHVLFTKIKRRLPTAVAVEDNGKVTLKSACPCGSGKKYKDCCYAKDMLAKAQAGKAPQKQEGQPLSKQEEYALKRAARKRAKNNIDSIEHYANKGE